MVSMLNNYSDKTKQIQSDIRFGGYAGELSTAPEAETRRHRHVDARRAARSIADIEDDGRLATRIIGGWCRQLHVSCVLSIRKRETERQRQRSRERGGGEQSKA